MVAPLANKNSLEKTGFKLANDGFVYHGSSYKFDNVIQTKYIRTVFQRKQPGFGVLSTLHGIAFELLMNTGQEIKVIDQPTWTSGNTLADVEHVQKIFDEISQKSWNIRVQKYENQIKERGYYSYAGWDFYPKEKKIFHVKTNKPYFINTTNFSREFGFVHVASKDEGIGAKLLKKVVGSRGIDTIIDTDVFFALFKHYFGIQWN